MNKAELASYLLSIHGLIEAQTKGSHSVASSVLGNEYEKHWELLKDAIRKDNEDEARNREQQPKRDESRTEINSNQPRRGEPDWPRPGQPTGS